MRMKLQKMGIGVETIIAMTHASDVCLGQLLSSMPGSMSSQCQKPVETISDQEYAKAMEERYGIREEGIF
ncbi:hypothetical protein D4R89_13735 [bacterium]|nr:MAG: hypothetical protein D4R89_13735 [bacterium]